MAAVDLLTPAEARAALNITDGIHDVEIATFISAVSIRIDGLCGPVVIRTVTDEVHDGGGAVLYLNQAPVASVTTITEYRAGVATLLTAEVRGTPGASNYLLDRELGAVYRRAGGYGSPYPPGRGAVVVTYQAGRYADTAAVDARFKQAAAIFLSHLWRFEQGQGTATFGPPGEGLGIPTFGTPNAVRDLLADQLKGPAIA